MLMICVGLIIGIHASASELNEDFLEDKIEFNEMFSESDPSYEGLNSEDDFLDAEHFIADYREIWTALGRAMRRSTALLHNFLINLHSAYFQDLGRAERRDECSDPSTCQINRASRIEQA